MGIRETLNKNPSITTGVTVGIILIALIFIIYSAFFNGRGRPRIITQAYYTIDEGQTYFADDINKVPPFDHDGAQAVACRVFSCDGGSHKWVGYLEKYPDKYAKIIRDAEAANSAGTGNMPGGQPPMMLMEQYEQQMLVKKPGPGNDWVSEMTHPDITIPKCPDGGTGPIEAEYP